MVLFFFSFSSTTRIVISITASIILLLLSTLSFYITNDSNYLYSQWSDGKVRLYRLSSAIRRLSQESRWQPISSREQHHHKASYPVSLIPTPRSRQRRHQQQLIISITKINTNQRDSIKEQNIWSLEFNWLKFSLKKGMKFFSSKNQSKQNLWIRTFKFFRSSQILSHISVHKCCTFLRAFKEKIVALISAVEPSNKNGEASIKTGSFVYKNKLRVNRKLRHILLL